MSLIFRLLQTVFVSSEFKWSWLVAGNRYLQCDGQGRLRYEVGGLTIRGWGERNYIKYFKRENKIFEKVRHIG